MKTFYDGSSKIPWPETRKKQIFYILMVPLTHLQALTIPNPMRGRNTNRENLYPVTLIMGMVWIWAYSFIIVWFTFDITDACGLHYNVLPMVLYPFGIVLIDYKRKVSLEEAIKAFNVQIKD